jgi:hypothetical protein
MRRRKPARHFPAYFDRLGQLESGLKRVPQDENESGGNQSGQGRCGPERVEEQLRHCFERLLNKVFEIIAGDRLCFRTVAVKYSKRAPFGWISWTARGDGNESPKQHNGGAPAIGSGTA